MSQTLINFAGHEFEPYPCGALYWPAEGVLIVSDLHFEKSSHFAAKGCFLPPYDTNFTLEKMHQICKILSPKTILFLGDIFHDANGLNRLTGETKAIFESLLNNHSIIWIDGNHDKGNAPKGITVHSTYHRNGVTFNHIAQKDATHEISGHYHPCVNFRHKGHKVRKPCFMHDDNKIIMPAYGSLTGGLDYQSAYLQKIMPDATILAIDETGLYRLSRKI